jgi:hypothetical protein
VYLVEKMSKDGGKRLYGQSEVLTENVTVRDTNGLPLRLSEIMTESVNKEYYAMKVMKKELLIGNNQVETVKGKLFSVF